MNQNDLTNRPKCVYNSGLKKEDLSELRRKISASWDWQRPLRLRLPPRLQQPQLHFAVAYPLYCAFARVGWYPLHACRHCWSQRFWRSAETGEKEIAVDAENGAADDSLNSLRDEKGHVNWIYLNDGGHHWNHLFFALARWFLWRPSVLFWASFSGSGTRSWSDVRSSKEHEQSRYDDDALSNGWNGTPFPIPVFGNGYRFDGHAFEGIH